MNTTAYLDALYTLQIKTRRPFTPTSSIVLYRRGFNGDRQIMRIKLGQIPTLKVENGHFVSDGHDLGPAVHGDLAVKTLKLFANCGEMYHSFYIQGAPFEYYVDDDVVLGCGGRLVLGCMWGCVG